jgi:tetratricopeptide (TPR) repeat protein
MGDYAHAIDDLTYATGEDSENQALSYIKLGNAYRLLGEAELAAAAYDQALALDPNYGPLLWGLEERLIGIDEVIEGYSQALEANSDDVTALLQRGHAYQLQGFYQLALADFTRAAELDPMNPDTYNGTGLAREFLFDAQYAVQLYSRAIEIAPDHADPYYNRRLVNQRLKNDAHAMADYNEAIRLDPGYTYAYFVRGQAYYKQGEYDRALADLNEYVRLAGDRADSRAADLIEKIEGMQ